MQPELRERVRGGGSIETVDGIARLAIPAGPAGTYRWAQLDDYMERSRAAFPWQPPVTLRLRARASAVELPGTWGFGLWNDPFSVSMGLGGMARRLPALPNAAWFFYAGQPNHLAFRDQHPAQGFLAASFSAPRLPSLLLAPGAPALPLLALRPAARWLRRAARLLIQEDAALVQVDPTQWHDYAIELCAGRLRYFVDNSLIFTTRIAPRPPLGLVIWIDNQFAAFRPDGQVGMGTSVNPAPAWIEVSQITTAPAPCPTSA